MKESYQKKINGIKSQLVNEKITVDEAIIKLFEVLEEWDANNGKREELDIYHDISKRLNMEMSLLRDKNNSNKEKIKQFRIQLYLKEIGKPVDIEQILHILQKG